MVLKNHCKVQKKYWNFTPRFLYEPCIGPYYNRTRLYFQSCALFSMMYHIMVLVALLKMFFSINHGTLLLEDLSTTVCSRHITGTCIHNLLCPLMKYVLWRCFNMDDLKCILSQYHIDVSINSQDSPLGIYDWEILHKTAWSIGDTLKYLKHWSMNKISVILHTFFNAFS